MMIPVIPTKTVDVIRRSDGTALQIGVGILSTGERCAFLQEDNKHPLILRREDLPSLLATLKELEQ